ncbi:hypothetical protein KFL_008160040 [Klebsormidium nitens]|uniref:SF3 helicase domain-containing protein n=1 Tax=Klebsormidium nitens TaxID=105231 RepID=A0A1Y1ILC8_KLENI|nr:hypothetical protein KFL_008160040 [Klebsormidium nitens]|eukprot:GAQ91604.1 hypothetical protein KFL_008160040 [Klebsormidium nitens]
MHSADPHSLHCHRCGATAEFGLRGSKEGGETRYLCSAHSAFNGCFCIDKDRAVWVQDRLQRRLKAEVVRLEEELRKMDKASSSAEPAKSSCRLPVWDEANFKVAPPSRKPMSHALLATLLMIGCSRPTPVESRGDWDVEDARMEESGGRSIEADSQGEDIEDVEFNREEESSDEETSQDRAFRNESPQALGRPPFCEYAAMDAELWPSKTESGVQLGGPRKRVKRVESEQSGESQPRQRRRRRVILSEAEAEADESGSEEGGQSATSSEWGDLRNDDDPFWDWDDERESEELRQYFSICRIDPRSGQERRESLARQAVSQHGEPMAPVAATTAATAGPSVRDASMSAATSALPSRANARAAVQEPTPFRQGPSPDPILAAAHHFHELGVVTLTHDLQEKRFPNGEVRKVPGRWPSRKPWNEANLGNCLQESRNTIAIVTEASDILAVDVDVKDGGFQAVERMLEEHGLFLEDTPRLTTGNGGMHVLFSLSQSAEAGLRNCANRKRIRYKGEPVGIDVRGRGGMLYTAPSSYVGLDGTCRCYEWDQEILPDRSNLRAPPDNESDEAPSEDGGGGRRGGEAQTAAFGPPRPVEDPQQPPPAAILKRVKACVADTGDTASRFDRLKTGVNGPMYVFRVDGPRRCPNGNHHDGSNNFSVLVRGRALLYCCNSSECEGVRPLRKIGELTRSEAMIGGEIRAFRADDASAIDALHKDFVDYWAFEGDVGGSKIAAAMYTSCGRLWFDGKRWWHWEGRRFVSNESDFLVKHVLINQLRIVYARVRDEWSAKIKATTDEEKKEELFLQLKHLRTYNNTREMSSTLELIKGELSADDLAQQLDANPDILNVKNGVLLLRTGELDAHRPQYMCSKITETDFKGIDYPSPLMDAFLGDIFNHDSELEEIFVLLLGAGGNGKGVLKETLQAATGDYYGLMSKDAVVTAPCQRVASKNAPTDYIYELMGVRLAITDETAEGEQVDLGLVLGMTGGGETKARPLHGRNVQFNITHTPFVQTNYPPTISASAVQDNVIRRLRVMPFPNSYVGADKFDPTNATHRLRDDGLKDRMKEEESLRQVLSWIARGSVEWYASANGLGFPPEAVRNATREYLSEMDKLQLFLDQHCEFGEGHSTLENDFVGLYNSFSSEAVSKEQLKRRMERKRFKRLRNNDSPWQYYYPGIKCNYEF